MKKLLIISFILFGFAISGFHTKACSGFYIAKDSVIMAAKNTDAIDWKSKIWFTPATDSTYGYVCFGFKYPYLSDGMNDKGLIVYHFTGHEKKITKSIHKPTYDGVLSELVLATCQTVNDVKVLLDKYNLNLFHNGMIMYSDKYGNSIIVEGDTIIEKKHFYQVCMNTYQSECNEDTHPFWKQVASKNLIPQAKEFSIDFCREVLLHMRDDVTQFSIIYDVNRLKFSVYLFHDYDHRIDFDLLTQLKNGKQIYDLHSFFPKESKYYQVYIQRQSPQNNIFILLTLIICGLAFMFTLIVWISSRLIKNLESKEKNEKMPEINKAKLLSFIICILLSIFLIVLINFKVVFQIGMPENFDNLPLILRIVSKIPLLVVVLIIPLIILNYNTLKKPDQSIYTKWHLSINTFLYLVLLGLFLYWGFIF